MLVADHGRDKEVLLMQRENINYAKDALITVRDLENGTVKYGFAFQCESFDFDSMLKTGVMYTKDRLLLKYGLRQTLRHAIRDHLGEPKATLHKRSSFHVANGRFNSRQVICKVWRDQLKLYSLSDE